MKYTNKPLISPSTRNAQSWYKLLALVFIVSILISAVGCKKESNSDEYYLKYEVNSSTIYYGGKLEATITSEANEAISYTIAQRVPWEITIGPVRKNFTATLKVNALGNTHNKLTLYTNIYVSKNNSPFALKESNGSDEPRDTAELRYTIDY